MSFHRRLWVTALLGLVAVVCAGLTPSAEADEIYMLNSTGGAFSRSFDVPAIGILTPGAAIAVAGTISDGAGKSSVVTEPSSLLLLGTGVASLVALRRRRSRKYILYREHGKRAIRLE